MSHLVRDLSCKNIRVSWSTSELKCSWYFNILRPISIFTDRSKRCFFCGSFLLFLFHVCLCYTVVSVFCSLVITCWGKYWPLGSRVSCVFLWCSHFPKWWIEPCVVLDCIDSLSLSSSLLRSLSTFFLSRSSGEIGSFGNCETLQYE